MRYEPDDPYEVRITVYRKGRILQTGDALGDSPSFALYRAYNDLFNDMVDYEREHPKEFPDGPTLV